MSIAPAPRPSPAPAVQTSLRLMKALALARQGRIKDAQGILTPGGEPPENTVELHGLAALVTSEGDFPRALKLWRQVQARDPGHPEARRMIDAIELWTSRPPWFRHIPLAAMLLGAVILGALAIWGLSAFA